MRDLREGCYYPSNKMSSVNILPLETLNKCGHLDQELCGSKLFPTISVTAPENVIHITEWRENGHNVKESESIIILLYKVKCVCV